MATTKPISTITYNTKPFLIQTLNGLIDMGYITYYEFIEHSPDTDDKKVHIHLYMLPAMSLNLSTFINFFLEPDPDPLQKLPLKPQPFRISHKFGDWYWYCLHDKNYLKSKDLKRNVFYSDNDIISFDYNFHKQLVLTNPLIDFCKMSDMMLRNYVCESVYNGVSLQEILSSGLVPLGKTQSVILLYNALYQCVDAQEKKDIMKVSSPQVLKEIKTDLFVNNVLNSPIDCEKLPFDNVQISINDELF